MLALLVALSLSQVTPDSRVTRVERVPGGRMEGGRGGVKAWAFFEAFPLGGAGTTTACSTTPPTGAKGEVLTFARTGNATCTKTATGGLATTGIANGDLVVMSANQPRVEYDSAGTLGLLVESARTNSAIRSEELDNAAWSSTGSTPSSPVITANYATAPDGTTTAERLQFPAVTGGENSSRFLTAACPASSASMTIYLRGTSSSGNVCLWSNDTAAGVNCPFTNSSWTRCKTANAGTASALVFGNLGSIAGCIGANSAQDVLAWGAQCEAGTYATSYIPTTSAAVTRNVETASFQGRDLSGLVASASTAATLDRPKLFDSAAINLTATVNTIGVMAPYLASNTSFGVYSGGSVATQAVPALNANTTRLATSWSGTTFSSWYAGNQVSAAGTAFAGTQTVVQLCDYNTSHSCDGVISRICLDPSPTRCR